MKLRILFIPLFGLLFFSCQREQDPVQEETDTSFPVVTLNSPADNSVYQNGDTVFISGTVTDNELHSGTIIIENDTVSVVYFNQYHYVHEMTSATISYFYVVTGVTQNEAVTLTATYEDHVPNTTVVTRKLFFNP